MLSLALPLALALVGAAFGLTLWRLIRGPSVPDRILALDTLAVTTIAILVLLGLAYESTHYFEAALLLAAMGFVGTVAFCKYLMRGDIIE